MIRFVYQVSGVLKFLSHLDLLKLFNRALLRAKLPVAYSEGFNPHPKISFGPPRGVGQEGRRELADLQLKDEVAPDEVCRRLNLALPKNVRVLSAKVLPDTEPALMAQINLAVYEAELPADLSAELRAELAAKTAAFLAADKIEIMRKRPKKRDKLIDLRSGVRTLVWQDNLLRLEIPFAEGGSVKPTEVLQYLLPPKLLYRLARLELLICGADGLRREP